MKSRWRVSSQFIGGENQHIVYRLLDINSIDHSGNREYHGVYTTDKKAAQDEADRLNWEDKT